MYYQVIFLIYKIRNIISFSFLCSKTYEKEEEEEEEGGN
jgi:hypothetical protein